MGRHCSRGTADAHWLQQSWDKLKMPPNKENLIEAFEKIDEEKTGKINLEQLQEILLAAATDEDEILSYQNKGMVDALLFAYDENEDGMLSLEELLKMDDYMDDEISIKIIKRCVEHSDKDKDGFLTAKELKGFLMMLNPGEDDEKYIEHKVKVMTKMCCHDFSRKVKADVVVQFIIDPDEINIDPKEIAKAMFRMLDTNADGFLDKKELLGYMKRWMSDDEEEDMEVMAIVTKMTTAGFDEDGKVNFEEFKKIMEQE